MIDSTYLTPQQIVAELDKYIVGQHDAKRNVAIALRNRWRRMNVKDDIFIELGDVLGSGPAVPQVPEINDKSQIVLFRRIDNFKHLRQLVQGRPRQSLEKKLNSMLAADFA